MLDKKEYDEYQCVTMSEFEDWTRKWLIEKFINSSQEPGVITANAPICFFYRDMMKEGMRPKASTDEIQKLFYTFMLDLYRIALEADDWYEHVPHIENNHINTLRYARHRLRELNGADAAMDEVSKRSSFIDDDNKSSGGPTGTNTGDWPENWKGGQE